MSEAMQLTLDQREVPVSRTIPRDESRMLRRPKDEALDVAAFHRQLDAALTRAGVGPGEAFYVARVPPVSREPLARASDPQTSHQAARAVRVTARNQCGRALTLIAHHGYTADELYEEEGIRWQRVSDLRSLGLIEPRRRANGAEDTRPTRAGTQATVWQLSEAGRERYRLGL